MKKLSEKRRLIVSSVIGLVLVVGMYFLITVNQSAIRGELVKLYLLPQPESFTELYFNNSQQLPNTITKSRTVDFVFVIHNLEASDYGYVYQVIVNNHGVGHIVDQGNVFLKNGGYFTKKESFKLASPNLGQEVVVELINKQQYINFWLGKS